MYQNASHNKSASSIITLSLFILTLSMMGMNSQAQAHESQLPSSSPTSIESATDEYIKVDEKNDGNNATADITPLSNSSIIIDATQQLKIAETRRVLLESSIADIQSRTLSAISKLKVLTIYIPDGQLKNELIKIIQILENNK